MKNLICFICAVLCLATNAQNLIILKTPEGKDIEAIANIPEMSAYEIEQLNKQTKNAFPQATFVCNSSSTYNCHSYAWNISEGGEKCWINQFKSNGGYNVALYWTNDAFVSISEDLAKKIFYPDGDHSAIRSIIEPDKYESKWGKGPVMRHAPGYGPYTNMAKRIYFVKAQQENSYETGFLECTINNRSIYVGEAATFKTPKRWSDEYSFEIQILNAKDEEDVIDTKAIINSLSSKEINVTFKAAGLYHITYNVYNTNRIKVASYTCEAAVKNP